MTDALTEAGILLDGRLLHDCEGLPLEYARHLAGRYAQRKERPVVLRVAGAPDETIDGTPQLRVKIRECGNGWPDVGDFVAGLRDGCVYRVVDLDGDIHTGTAGAAAWITGTVTPADWTDVPEDANPACTCVTLGSEAERP